MQDDLTIARGAKLKKIIELAKDRLNIDADDLEPYGHYKAKLSSQLIKDVKGRPDGKLILVTAITPTPAGEGKTTTTIGLGDALNAIGEKAMICVREPSLGPCFGAKGGGAGGGYSQVAPMEDINLHFTGDFHAVSIAHNLLAALVDNHIQHGNALGFDLRRVTWRRVVDLNDRALRNIVVGLGGTAHGYPRETGYDIVAASEVMAILCLSTSLNDMKERFSRIIVGYTRDQKPIRAGDINAQGSMAVLMKEAIKPNLVQTLENTPTFVHGGPFANIAHGCNSALATQTALKLADYVVTEAGFGADLGAEKFVDIKCRKTGLRPSLTVLVGTVRALKYSGGAELKDVNTEDTKSLMQGMANLDRHVLNIREHFGLPVIVALNRFGSDTDKELNLVKRHLAEQGVQAFVCEHFAKGSKGALDLARAVAKMAAGPIPELKFVYDDADTLWRKIGKVAKSIYGASEVVADT
ncbi:MAG TPA: formate--tetrahydrofolate ligase, partial [Gammaproteobacteria bacterium]|nr:formate--tetrahydrofolate ligase [Gammaproteobacteria bacterium]